MLSPLPTVVFLAIKSSVFIVQHRWFVQPKYNVRILYCCAVCYIHSTRTLKELLTSIISSVALFIVVFSSVYRWLFDLWLTNLVHSASVSFLLIQECMHQLLALFPGLPVVVVVVVVVVVLRFCIQYNTRAAHNIPQWLYWKKLEVDLTQDGLPQLQDLVLYHLLLLPQCRITDFVYSKVWILALNTAQKLSNSAWIVFRVHPRTHEKSKSSTPFGTNMHFIWNPIHCFSLDKGLNPGKRRRPLSGPAWIQTATEMPFFGLNQPPIFYSDIYICSLGTTWGRVQVFVHETVIVISEIL